MPVRSAVPERRAVPRYNLSLPIEIGSLGQDRADWRHGTVRDISRHGVYFVLDGDPGIASALCLRITFPAELAGGSDTTIEATGSVIRVEYRSERRIGIAAAIDRFEVGSFPIEALPTDH